MSINRDYNRRLEKALLTSLSIFAQSNALREYNCLNVNQNLFVMPYTNEILHEIGKPCGMDLTEKYKTANDLRKLLKH